MDLALSILGLVFLTVGVVFLILAGIGVARLPDAFQRMHASTKAGTLGASFSVVGAALMLPDIRLTSVGFTILFLLLTLPVAAQLLARAAYKSGAHLRVTRGDPLADVLKREHSPLEERAFAQGEDK
ncbi:MAG TPA: monovalent cation/H(+) antiporter subunit G [Pedomonas sp.]|uniref:monovalent cation/H(+) antiporter subunit G n=1 Tax=Pedomonas sp. TaxID=2976421 RepID=UPI002F406346